jgi:beta-glucanase (GH16 family)
VPPRQLAIFCLLSFVVVCLLSFVVVGAPSDAGAKASHGRLVWADDFEGPSGSPPDAMSWSFDTGGRGWGDHERQYYTANPQNAQLDGHGHLAITARAETYTGPDGVRRRYTSARLQTYPTFQFTYGTVAARIRVPAGKGLHAAFWSLGESAYRLEHGWPYSGEIDMLETLGSTPHVVHGSVHGPWPWAPGGLNGSLRSHSSLSSGFHTYAMRWSPGRISFSLNGVTYKTIKRSELPRGAKWPFRRPMFLLLSLAVGGSWPGPPNPATRFPASMLVDWVRVWK